MGRNRLLICHFFVERELLQISMGVYQLNQDFRIGNHVENLPFGCAPIGEARICQ